MLTMDTAVVYTVVGDLVIIIWMVWVSGTNLAELVVLFSGMCPITGIPGSRVQLMFFRILTAYTFLESYHSLNNLQSAILNFLYQILLILESTQIAIFLYTHHLTRVNPWYDEKT